MRGPDEPRESRPLDVSKLHVDELRRIARPAKLDEEKERLRSEIDRAQRAEWRREERRNGGKVIRR